MTVIIDLTPVRDGTGPARLLDMVEGRSRQASTTWLASRPQAWHDGIEVVAMDGFSGVRTATTEELPDATPVLDPFHVVRLAGDALDQCRRRVRQQLHGHRGRATDPLYRARRTLHTGCDLPTPRQQARLDALLASDDHVEVEATWAVYQEMVAAYREPDRAKGRKQMETVIQAIASSVPGALAEAVVLGRTLKKRADDVLAYLDRPSTPNGPTEAVNGRPEHLRGSTLGLRDPTHYIARSPLKTGRLRPRPHPRMRRAR